MNYFQRLVRNSPIHWFASDWRWYRRWLGGTWWQVWAMWRIQGGITIWDDEHPAYKRYPFSHWRILQTETWGLRTWKK